MSVPRATSPAEELDFRTSIEALFVDELGRDMTPRLRARLKEVGIDLDHLVPAYPRKVFSAGCRAAVEELYPGLAVDEGLQKLGRRLVEGLSRSLIGKAAIGVFKLIGVRRGLERLTRAFRNGDNYTEISLTLIDEGKADLHFNQVNGQPTFTQGMLEACLAWVGAKDYRVIILRTEGDGCIYRMTWRDR